jgi:hypothetical protein
MHSIALRSFLSGFSVTSIDIISESPWLKALVFINSFFLSKAKPKINKKAVSYLTIALAFSLSFSRSWLLSSTMMFQ